MLSTKLAVAALTMVSIFLVGAAQAQNASIPEMQQQIANLQEVADNCIADAEIAEKQANEIRQAANAAGEPLGPKWTALRKKSEKLRACAKSSFEDIDSLRKQIDSAQNPNGTTVQPRRN